MPDPGQSQSITPYVLIVLSGHLEIIVFGYSHPEVPMKVFFILSLTLFIHSVTCAADSCAWQKRYGKNYWDSRAPSAVPASRMREKLRSHARYQALIKKKELHRAEIAEVPPRVTAKMPCNYYYLALFWDC